MRPASSQVCGNRGGRRVIIRLQPAEFVQQQQQLAAKIGETWGEWELQLQLQTHSLDKKLTGGETSHRTIISVSLQSGHLE